MLKSLVLLALAAGSFIAAQPRPVVLPVVFGGDFQSTLPDRSTFSLNRIGTRLHVRRDSKLIGILDAFADQAEFQGNLRFPQTDSCAPQGIPVLITVLGGSRNLALHVNMQLPAEGECRLQWEPGTPPLQQIELSRSPGLVPYTARFWSTPSLPRRVFSISIDATAISIFEWNLGVGVLHPVKDKRTKAILRYEGQLGLPPASGCPGGKGFAIAQAQNISTRRIVIRIQEPVLNPATGEPRCARPLFSATRDSIGPEIEFVLQEQ